MSAQSIELVIGTDGTVIVEGQHYSGAVCDKELRAIAEALGVVESVSKKPEYYAAAAITVTAQTKG